MAEQQEQPQQINEEIKKELLGKGNEKSKNSSSATKSKNWVFQFIKDFAYICFFPFNFLWDFMKKIHSPSKNVNKQQPVHFITENKSEKSLSSDNNTTSISNSNEKNKTFNANNVNKCNQDESSVVASCNNHKNDNDQTTIKKPINYTL